MKIRRYWVLCWNLSVFLLIVGLDRRDWGERGSATDGKDMEGGKGEAICDFEQISTMFFCVSYPGYFLCSLDLNTV